MTKKDHCIYVYVLMTQSPPNREYASKLHKNIYS